MKLYKLQTLFLLTISAVVPGIGSTPVSASTSSIPAASVSAVPADTAARVAEPKLQVRPAGRALFDGAVYTFNEEELFPAGVAIPDVRLGLKASYGKWNALVDLGFAYGKVAMKDIYIQHAFNDRNLLRVGYFIHQFGLQSATSSSMKISMEEPMVHTAIGNPRLFGLMYVYDNAPFFATASLYAESKALTFNSTQMRKTGYGGISRLAWRPLRGVEGGGQGDIAQVGISFQAGSPQFNGDPDEPDNHVYSVVAGFPTQVAKVQAVGAQVHDVNSMFKFTPEILAAHGPLAVEAQYYYMQLHRLRGLPTYRAWGAYGMLRCLATGGNYRYSHGDAALATPAPKSLEFVLGYNYINTTDRKSAIRGGRASDLSLTANWYINKYIIWRLRAAYTYRFDRAGEPDINLGALQTRFQILF